MSQSEILKDQVPTGFQGSDGELEDKNQPADHEV